MSNEPEISEPEIRIVITVPHGNGARLMRNAQIIADAYNAQTGTKECTPFRVLGPAFDEFLERIAKELTDARKGVKSREE
jgi:hypothetical protein